MLVVGSMVGTGILFTPAVVSSATSSALENLLLWLGGGIYAMAGALTIARLAVIYPNAGGDYVYLRASYGPALAFLSGWVTWTVGFSGALAGMGMACGQYFLEAMSLEGKPAWSEQGVAVSLILGLTLVNLRSVGSGSRLQSAITLLKVTALVAFAGASLGYAPSVPEPSVGTSPFFAAFLPVVFAYSGWNDSIYVAGEVKNPGRNLPVSLVAGTLVVTAIYLFFAYSFWATTGGGGAEGSLAAASSMARAAFGGEASRYVSVLAAVLVLGTMAALVVSGPRIAYAMSRDRALPAAFSKLNRGRVPANALFLQAAIATAFIAVGSLKQIIEWVGFTIVVFSTLAVGCVFVEEWKGQMIGRLRLFGRSGSKGMSGSIASREGEKGKGMGYLVPLHPLPPLLYIIISLGILTAVVIADPVNAQAGLVFTLAGLPVYWWSRRRS